MPITINGTGSITGISAGGLPDASVTADDLASNAVTTAKIADANITAAKLDGAQSGSAPIYGARAWVNFNGTGTVAIRASGNVSSITDQGTGSYTINFTTAMPDVNYSLIATGGNVQLQYGAYALDDSQYRGRTTTACSVASYSASNNLDNQYMNIAIFR